jgi:hypothetical protein
MLIDDAGRLDVGEAIQMAWIRPIARHLEDPSL